MNPHDIHMIEQSLHELENTDETQLSQSLVKFFMRVCNAVDLPYTAHENRDPRDGCDVLFRRKNSLRKKNFIAVCLLRLLCRNEEIIWNHREFRIKTFRLFDDQISSKYKRFKISQDEPNDKKLGKLLESEKTVLANFQAVTDSVLSLGAIPSLRQKFMSTLSSDFNMLFLEQFVTPSSLINSERINQILATAQAYLESAMEDRIDIFEDLKHVFDPFLHDVGKHPSIFTKHCIVAPLEKIYNYVQEDFKSNDANKSTTIEIIPLDRKYPFHEKNRDFDLKFQVVNSGPGYAFDIHITCEEIKGLAPCNPVNLGTLRPKQSPVVVFPTTTKTETEVSPIVVVTVSWWNFNRSDKKTTEFIYELQPQRDDLNWNKLKLRQPYSLEPIERSDDMVGRDTLINQLQRRLLAPDIESSIICGQKRVGKTSIAKFIETDIGNRENYTVILISIGGLDKTTSERFVSTLGDTIVDEVSYKCDILADMETEFESSLSPLRKYFRDARKRLPYHRFVIILDEFDEIPLDMVRYSSTVGDTFFHNIRDISSLGNVGFILVGGENMRIIQQSTDRLNRMEVLQVDYFDKEGYWEDFRELVKRPVRRDLIEFNDEAIDTLYETTEGNPFYTKIICRKIYTQACEDRNAYISEDNIEQAISAAARELDLNHFNHLWKDGIFVDDPAKKDQIETQRRKFLIAFAQIERKKQSVNKYDFQDSELLKNEVAVEQIIENYKNRGVLIEDSDSYRWKPKIFQNWLRGIGYTTMTTSFLDEAAITASEKEEQEAYVEAGEISELRSQFGLYKGSEITSDDIRGWLNQFENNIEKRLMFRLLQRVKFYNELQIREKVRGLHRIVQQDIARRGIPRPASGRRTDILLSSFGAPSKSGASYARLYAHGNRIAYASEVSFADIPHALNNNDQIKAMVFVDDIIGSGTSAVQNLDELNEKCGELLRAKQVKVFIAAICGLHTGIKKLEYAIEKVPFDAEVIVSDSLTESDQCFSNESEIFPSPQDREKAEGIALKNGKKLENKIPLGFQNSQLLVVFYDNCPNNTLPILWKKPTSKIEWTPLFIRT